MTPLTRLDVIYGSPIIEDSRDPLASCKMSSSSSSPFTRSLIAPLAKKGRMEWHVMVVPTYSVANFGRGTNYYIITYPFLNLSEFVLKVGPLDRERPITIDDNEAVDDDDDNATTKKGFVRCWDGDVTQTRKWSRGEGWCLDIFALVPIGRDCEELKFLGNVQQLIRLHITSFLVLFL